MPQVGGLQGVSGGGIQNGLSGWWNYVLGYDYNTTEPYGGFAKPDLNFNVPPNNQITTILGGTITAIDGNTQNGYAGNNQSNLPAWGHVVTIKLDSPYTDTSGANASSIAYLHLSSVNGYVGQHIGAGQSIGVWNGAAPRGTQNADPGFALGNGTNYGYDPGSQWAYGFLPGLAPKDYNPTMLIQSLQGKPIYNVAQQVQTNSGQCGSLDIPCQINALWTNMQKGLVSFGEHIAVFAIALLLIILGVVLLKDSKNVS